MKQFAKLFEFEDLGQVLVAAVIWIEGQSAPVALRACTAIS